MKKHVFSKTYIGLLSFLLFMGFYTEGVAQCSCTDCRCSDSLALVAFYNATGGQNWTTKNNNGEQCPWILSQNMATWYGVRLNANGRVECLDLDGANDCQWTVPLPNGLNLNTMNGIPQEIGDLSDLKRLFIGYNPNLIGKIPTTIGQLSKLEKLYLERNGLSGTVPVEMGQLSNLQSLALSVNWKLKGDVSNIFSKLRNLTEIYLYTNEFSGNVGWLDSLKNLQYIVLAHNLYTGSIPNLNLPDLKVLDLSENELTGSIPNFQNLPNLENLALHTNKQLTGSIPNFNLPKLTELFLYNDSLMGNLPNFQYLTNLRVLSLYSNKLTGSIPSNIGQMTQLQYLNLGGNRFVGNIPALDLPSLKYLYLSENLLQGSIPNFNTPNLVHLQLQGNQLTGGIPATLNNLTKLELLWLGRNPRLGGTIPRLDNLTALKYLAFEADSLTGNMPDWFGNMTNLVEIGLSSNKLSGEIPANIGNLKKLKILWLGSNQLTGVVPTTLGGLDSLELLTLDNNQFKGSLPESMKNLNNLWQLYISKNQFSNILQNATLKIGQGRRSYISTLPTPKFIIDQNTLTFSNILPYINRGFEFLYNPQDSIYKDTTITARVTEPLSIDLNIDATVTTNSYQWYKNGQKFRTPTNSNKLVFDKLLPTDAGVYTCQVTNSLAGALTLYSRKITVVVTLTCRYSDSIQLVALYNATKGQSWAAKNANGKQSPWQLNQPMTTWHGVMMNTEGCVIDLILNQNNLAGNLPNINIPNLVGLNLDSNHLSNSIPNLNLPNLQSLALSRNQLIGSIPNFNLPNLKYLNLNNNPFSTSIPKFDSLPNLQELYLYSCQLIGSIPKLNLPNLTVLNLVDNKGLSGSIPNELGALSKLAYLNLSNCSLTQSIPNSLATLNNLIGIALSDNQLTGTIPNFQSKKLTQILLWRNKLSGNIPDFDLPELWGFNVEGNKTISGNIPEFRKCPKLVFFNARDNILVGDLPSYEWLKDSLQYLLLDNNKINATTIPAYNLPRLKSLSIGWNMIKATLPSFNLPKATEVWLHSNELYGSIPSMVLSDTVDLRLDNNQLGGKVSRFSRAKYVAIGKNKFTFEGVLTNVQNTAYTYSPQDSIYKDTTIKIIPNTPLSISLGIDSTVTTNSYQWYKNGKEFGVATSSNTLTINALTFEHAGVYTCTVSNPIAPNLKLYSRPITLTTGRIETTKVETAISPNGDGMNDALDFPDANLEGHPENAIEIYNRWGQLVYKASPYKRDWSGQDLNGQLLPAGDYFFIMRVSIGDGQIIVGSVYLSR